MSATTTDEIKLYGTDEPVQPLQLLTAGPITAYFDQGALRFIKIYGTEAIRNIAFVVRDKDWGTYTPAISNLKIDQQPDSFFVSFDAVCTDGIQQINYSARIVASAEGTLSFSGAYKAVTDFQTNRAGFVVLHPISGVCGKPVSIEHVDGSIEQSVFPELIDPIQPFRDIRALTHVINPGISVCCKMTGDTFEMEDHRQWNDASYKTYVRPLSLPWPYTLAAGDSKQQVVTITADLDAGTTTPSANSSNQKCIVTVGGRSGFDMPAIGVGLEPQHLDSTVAVTDLLKQLELQQLVIWHEVAKHGSDQLKTAAKLCQIIGATPVLHTVIADRDYKSEIKKLSDQCNESSLQPAYLAVSPEIYLKSITPGNTWPQVTPLADLYDEVRRRFPDVIIGGGMLAFFPELNRHRPPTSHMDYITHASNTITHACDDISATENLEAIPWVIKTCRSFADNLPYHTGPSSIGMRFNPYGSKTMDNPDNKRIAMARMDPRQRGLLNAAWSVGYVAHMARRGVDAINLHAPTGEFGIIYHSQCWPQPGFDNNNRQVFPAYHIVKGFAKRAGKPCLQVESTMSREVQALAYESENQKVIWLANLTADHRIVTITGLTNTTITVSTLSVETFDQCTLDSDGFGMTSEHRSVQPGTCADWISGRIPLSKSQTSGPPVVGN